MKEDYIVALLTLVHNRIVYGTSLYEIITLMKNSESDFVDILKSWNGLYYFTREIDYGGKRVEFYFFKYKEFEPYLRDMCDNWTKFPNLALRLSPESLLEAVKLGRINQ